MIRAILACDDKWGIGKDNTLPWPHNLADLTWFKKCTVDGVVVMGRMTWESLPTKPLPRRTNIVVSNTFNNIDGAEVVKSDIYKSRLNVISQNSDVWIIGGSYLVNSSLNIIDEIWLSRIDGDYNCDVFLPRTAIELTYNLVSSEYNDGVHVDKWRKDVK